MAPYKVALVGAGGKMGCRLTDNLKSSQYQMHYLEVSEVGIERLATRGIKVSTTGEVIPSADIVILAVPDIYIGKVAGEMLQQFKPGTLVVTLDPAAAVGGHLPTREDISYFVSHPTHPSVFNWEEDKKRHFDYFGGITARQAIVCALMQGPEAHYAIGEDLAKTMYAPVTRAHRITVEQMALLEPGLAETFLGAVMFTMREAMDEVIKKGVPKDAVFDFFMGHINIDLALCFDQIPGGVFSDACYKAIQIGRPLIFKEDWKKVLDPEHVKYQVDVYDENNKIKCQVSLIKYTDGNMKYNMNYFTPYSWDLLKINLIIFILCFFSTMVFAQLQVSPNKRFLQTNDGKPFFWLGDTAWELFHRLSREEATQYLKNRSDKGFTVIQAVVLAELDGLHDPNAYGEIPLENDDPTKPREAYFQHVDFIVRKAAELNLYIGMLPTWGDKIFMDRWGKGPEIFTAENARVYGKWIGNRYKNDKNIIWILGGDRNPRNERDLAIWRAMAAGIEEAIGRDNALMTFHPQPTGVHDGGSAKWFHQDPWLDFNMLQTGHCREIDLWNRIEHVYDLQPVKPVFDGEPIYEDHPVCFYTNDLGTSSAYDVRKAAYHDVFSGAFGHTYGCHDIWQMYAPNRTPINGPHHPWYVAIDLPGSGQMKHLRTLVESRPMFDRIPDTTLVTDALGANDRVLATRGADYIFVYSTQGKKFTVNTSKISGKEIITYWYNPRNGETKDNGRAPKKDQQEFIPPTSGYGHDWVLIVDDVTKNYPKPGLKK